MRRIFSFAIILLMLLLIGAMTFVSAIPTSAQAAVSWAGLFFPTTNLSGTSVQVVYPSGLNQNWGTGAPRDGNGAVIAGIGADNFSARLSTTTTLNAGFYEFTVLADDGVKVFVNGTAVINDFGATGRKQRNAMVQVTSSGTFQIDVEYVEFTGEAMLQVNWVVSTGTPQPTSTPQPIALVNVSSAVRGLALRTGPFLGSSLVGVARPGTDFSVLARNTQEVYSRGIWCNMIWTHKVGFRGVI